MVKLNCMARKCVNNEGGLCGAEYILIEGTEAEDISIVGSGAINKEDTCCETFIE